MGNLLISLVLISLIIVLFKKEIEIEFKILFVFLGYLLIVALSIIFNVIGWILASKKKITTCWVSVSSLAFVALTLLMEYRIILNWVNAEDWIALLDVVPTMFTILTGYVIIMFLANAILIGFAMKKIKLK